MDLTASSAVNRPISNASLRLVVIRMGARSIRCTYSGARVPPRFTFTINWFFSWVFLVAWGHKAKWEAAIKPPPISVTGHLISRGLAGSLGFDGRLAANTYFDLRGLGFDPLGEVDLQHALVTVGAHLSRIH